jgi:hypothetical protein
MKKLKDIIKPPFLHRVSPTTHYISVGFARYEDDPETLTIDFNFDLKKFGIEDEFFEYVVKALNNQWKQDYEISN